MQPNEDSFTELYEEDALEAALVYDDEIEQAELEQAFEFSESDTRNSDALEPMERFVLDFLDQLSRSSGPPLREDSDVDGRTARSELAVVNLQIADRRRSQEDGSIDVVGAIRSMLIDSSENPQHVLFDSLKINAAVMPGVLVCQTLCLYLFMIPSFCRPATLFRVIEISHEGLVRGTSATKRDIYYNDVALFQSQSTVNKLVDDLAATWGVARSHLNITAACKGLWCGVGLSMITKNGSLIAGQSDEPNLIPAQENIERIQICEQTAWILVVEKDAVFQTLCRAGLATHSALPGPGVIVTGKGYPDIATRELVSTLSKSTTIPLLALVDCDPHGVDIFSCYKYGSKSLRHEQERLQAHRLQWIGVLSSDLCSIDKDDLLPLSARDHTKALALLRSPACTTEPIWRREITRMIHTRRKAEVEIVASRGNPGGSQGSLVDYVLAKIAAYCGVDAEWEDFGVVDM